MSRYFSPGKLNLFFRVLSKRSDGFREMASLSSAVDFGDFVSVQHAEKDVLFSREEDLIHRTRELFRQETGIYAPVSIILKKVVPDHLALSLQSSNAATALWGLNELFRRPLSMKELQVLAPQISSEAPFFFGKGISYCRGRGDLLEEVNAEFTERFWVASLKDISNVHVNVYESVKPNDISKIHPEDLLDFFIEKTPLYVNDLQQAVFRMNPQMELLHRQLSALGFSNVMLIGACPGFLCTGGVMNPVLSGVDFYPIRPIIKKSGDQWFPLCPEKQKASVEELLI